MAERTGNRSFVSEPDAASRLLVRGVNWLGDAVMTTPALQRLRERFSRAQITLLTHEKLADIWQGHPSLDAVMTFCSGENPWLVARRLRERGFQIALILPNSPRSAFEAWAARIPCRVGYARRWRNWFLTNAIEDRPQRLVMRKLTVGEIRRRVRLGSERRPEEIGGQGGGKSHQIHEYLHLAAALGASAEPLPTRLSVSPEEARSAAVKFQLGEVSVPLIGLNPGAEYGPAKRWPIQRFATAAREIRRRSDCVFLVLGEPPTCPRRWNSAQAWPVRSCGW